jgi:hypothetical protein
MGGYGSIYRKRDTIVDSERKCNAEQYTVAYSIRYRYASVINSIEYGIIYTEPYA